MRRTREWATVLLVAATLGTTACSNGGRGAHSTAPAPFTIAAVAQSMAAIVKTARVVITRTEPQFSVKDESNGTPATTTTTTARSSSKSLLETLSGTTTETLSGGETETATGTFDFERDRGELRVRGELSDVNLASTELFDGARVYASIDSYYARAIPAAVTRGKHWLEFDHHTYLSPKLPDPYSELADLRARGVVVHDLGPTTIGGVPVEHLRAVESRVQPTGIAKPKSITLFDTDDLYVDGRSRLVRMAIGTSATKTAKPELTTTIAFHDYGIAVDPSFPSPSDTVVYDSAIDPSPVLRGPWTLIATGATRSFGWKLFHAPADRDRECWSFEPSLPVQGVDLTAQLAATLGLKFRLPRHDGHASTCTRTGAWQSEIQTATVGLIAGKEVVVGITRADVTAVSVRTEFASWPVLPPYGPHRLSLDGRFGFVDTDALPGAVYRATKSDGSHTDCDLLLMETAPLSGPRCQTIPVVAPTPP